MPSSAMVIMAARSRFKIYAVKPAAPSSARAVSPPLYRLKTTSAKVAQVLTALAEGLDVSAAVRVFGYGENTIRSWLTHAGLHADALHARQLQHLSLFHIQLDELRTSLRNQRHSAWLWLAIDPRTKLLPVLELGPRSLDMAFKVVHQLGQTLTQGCLPVFTSDGLNFYFYALTAHFGQWIHEPGQRKPRWQVAANLLYAQVLKTYRRRQITRVAQRVQCGTLEAVKAMLQQLGFSGRINTAFIERANLTVRQGVAALARRTWATAQSLGELRLQLSWWRAYYHFVRPPAALRLPLAFSPCDSRQRYRPRTPAMAAGLTDHRWTVVEFLALALPPQPA